jgi:hypothetical protein
MSCAHNYAVKPFLRQAIDALFELQGAAERTPRFGRGIASDGERVQWWEALRRTAVYVPFSVYTMAYSREHRAFIVEEFIKKMVGLVMISGGRRVRHI